jgi:hypothetical protein
MAQTLKKTNTQNKINTVGRLLRINQPNGSSPPDVELMRKIKQRIVSTTIHPMFRLSIEDYQNMCNDDEGSNGSNGSNKMRIMALLLDTTTWKLRKICKNMHILKEYINSSPESIKNKKSLLKMSIRDLPEDLRFKFTEVFGSLFSRIRDWVLNNKRFHISGLSENPNAIDYLTDNPDQIHWTFLSKNPKAIKLLEKKIKEENKLTETELINLAPKDKISWQYLSENPEAKKLLEAKFKKEQQLSVNVLAQGIRTHKSLYLNWVGLSANPCAIDLLKINTHKIDWRQLAINPNPEAAELLNFSQNSNRVVWRGALTENPNFNTELPDLSGVSGTQNDIDWFKLSRLANNEEHMELLQKRAEYEDTLTDAEYMSLGYSQKISWDYLTINPAIVIK